MFDLYVKAVEKKIIDDINYHATVTTMVPPVGVAGTIAGIIGPATSSVSGAIDGNFNSSVVKETLQFAATQYMTRIYGLWIE